MVECQLPKLDVAGSTPVSRSILFQCFAEKAKVQEADFASFIRLLTE